MTKLLDKLKSIIEQDDLYVIFVNGEIVAKRTNQIIEISNNKTSELVVVDYTNAKKFNYLYINSDTNFKIFHIITEDNLFTQQIEVANDTKVTVYEYLYNETACSFSTSLVANANSELNYLHIKEGVENTPLNYKIYNNAFDDAKINLHNLNVKNSMVTEYIEGELLKNGAEYNVYTVDINSSQQKHHLDVIARHKVGNSKSQFSCFGIVDNNSHSLINTNGIIHHRASNSNMNHNIKGIVLDQKSTITTNPILEIDEYDVVAGHGASVGDVSQDEIYYLMSRGLTFDQSRKLIITSLVTPILDGFEDELFSNFVLEIINNNI